MFTTSTSSPARKRVAAAAMAAAALVVAVVVVVVVDGSGTTRQPGRTTPASTAPAATAPVTAGSGLKRPLAGLLTRDGPPGATLAPAVSGWVVNADWSDLQPAADGPLAPDNVIDR